MEVYYILSPDVEVEFQVIIKQVVGLSKCDMFPQKLSPYFSSTSTSENQELFVQVTLHQKGHQIGLPVRTAVNIFSKNTCNWEERLRIPVRICDFSDDVQIVLTVYTCNLPLPDTRKEGQDPDFWKNMQPRPLGSVTLPLFDEHRTLRTGKQKLPLWEDIEGDGRINSKTLFSKLPAELSQREKLLQRLETREKEYLPVVIWLDKLKDRKKKKIKRSSDTEFETNIPHLMIELQNFRYPVIFDERYSGRKGTQWRSKDLALLGENVVFDRILESMMRSTGASGAAFAAPVDPAEALARRFARSGYQRQHDKSRTPNTNEKKKLEGIINSLSKRTLTTDETDMLYKFRYWCVDKPRALTKFLRCITWENESEVLEALELMKDWEKIHWADALELLSPNFKKQEVRDFAVQRLEESDDDEFYAFTMELVKALEHEGSYPSKLSHFLLKRSMNQFKLFNWLYWNVKTESLAKPAIYKTFFEDLCKYCSSNMPGFMEEIERQEWLVTQLIALSEELRTKGRAGEKKKYLVELVSQSGKLSQLLNFPKKVRLPTNPEVSIHGIVPSKCIVFKSALCPVMVCFKTTDDKFERVIWKCGDDLRQDQMIMQFIKLMDTMMKKENLNMHITPYACLATSPDTGFLEFVFGSSAVASVLSKYKNDIKEFLRQKNQKPQQQAKALDNFVTSCAGYCVITYLLGIGDRHLDNLLLTEDGRLVHIDFGYIFGEDPKPFVPPMKICKEMIECMGGNQGKHYQDFQRDIIMVYKCLRRNSNLILNLIMIMTCGQEEVFMQNATEYVEERFALQLTDKEVERRILSLVEESVAAIMPQVMEAAHKFATYWR